MDKIEHRSLYQRFPLLHYLAAVLCFVCFPVFILNSGIDRVLQIKRQKQLQELKTFAGKKLQELEKFSDNSFFGHYLFLTAGQKALASKTPIKAAADQFEMLKASYPGAFKVIIANEKGRLIDKFSDIRNFKYLYGKAFSLIDDLQASVETNYPGDFGAVKDHKKRIQNLRPLLGDIFKEDDLFRPLLNLSSGKTLLCSTDSEKFHLWFQNFGSFKVIVFLSRKFIKGNEGLIWRCNYLKKMNPEFIFGFSKFPAVAKNIFPDLDERRKIDLAIVLGKHEQVYPGELIFEKDSVYSCRALNQDLRGFCIFPAKRILQPETAKLNLVAWIFKAIFILVFVFSIYRKLVPFKLTVKFKLLLLFGYSLVVPAILVIFLGLDFYQQKEDELIMIEQEKNLKVLQGIDQYFPVFIKDLAQKINSRIDSRIERDGKKFVNEPNLKKLSLELKNEFEFDGAILVNLASEKIFPKDNCSRLINLELVNMLEKDVLAILSCATDNPDLQGGGGIIKTAFKYVDDPEKLITLGVGDFFTYDFQKFISLSNLLKDKYMLMLAWHVSSLQEMCVNKYLKEYKNSFPGRPFFAFNYYREAFFHKSLAVSSAVSALISDAERNLFSISEKIILDDKPFIGVALKGNNLSNLGFSILVPYDNIEEELRKLRLKGFFAVILLAFLILGVAGLSQRHLLSPMKELKLSVDAIGNKNFRFRANLTSENEFGKLGAAFNQSLENLGELDLANVVQQTLLPEKKFKQNNLTILTFSRYMSKLGGDCFSINKKENDVVSVFLGDISGHGIPAALNMAITRSILLYEENLGYPSETPLHALNKIFLSLRSAENKDYLTAQIIDFNSKDGSFSYINAGQTYPLLLKKNGEDAEYLKNVGLPVGFSKKAQYKAVSGTLENGDTLIMITDGFIEAFNDSKIMLGFDGFKELVKSSWDQDIDVFQNNILEGFKKWTKNPGDDISILLVRYEKE